MKDAQMAIFHLRVLGGLKYAEGYQIYLTKFCTRNNVNPNSHFGYGWVVIKKLFHFQFETKKKLSEFPKLDGYAILEFKWKIKWSFDNVASRDGVGNSQFSSSTT